jgi:hypothetical protein
LLVDLDSSLETTFLAVLDSSFLIEKAGYVAFQETLLFIRITHALIVMEVHRAVFSTGVVLVVGRHIARSGCCDKIVYLEGDMMRRKQFVA